MKLIGNLLWLVLTGLASALAWFILGVIWCITIIGIPFGKQCFKIAKLSAWPFGTTVKTNFGSHPIANVIWILFGGLELCIAYLVVGVIWCVTIIGIPMGLQAFKLTKLALLPFGASVNS